MHLPTAAGLQETTVIPCVMAIAHAAKSKGAHVCSQLAGWKPLCWAAAPHSCPTVGGSRQGRGGECKQLRTAGCKAVVAPSCAGPVSDQPDPPVAHPPLAVCRAGLPIAIATGGNRPQVEKSLRAVDMFEGEPGMGSSWRVGWRLPCLLARRFVRVATGCKRAR